MATAPETELQKVEAVVSKVWTFDKTHIVLIICLFVALLGGFYLYDSKRADKANAAAAQAQEIAQVQDKTNQQVQALTLAQLAALQQSNLNLQNEVASLEATVASRNASLNKQQNALPAATAPQIVSQWQILVPEGTIAYDPANALFSLDRPAAQETVKQLLSVPVLTQDNADLAKSVSDLKTEVSNDDAALKTEIGAHQSDIKTCTEDKAALNATIVQIKADAKKSKWHWFGIGYVAGFISRMLLVK
jgi:uncharacterized protein YlxW (UPF0749 family)